MQRNYVLAMMAFLFGLLLINIGVQVATIADIELEEFFGKLRLEKTYPYSGLGAILIFLGLALAFSGVWAVPKENSKQTQKTSISNE